MLLIKIMNEFYAKRHYHDDDVNHNNKIPCKHNIRHHASFVTVDSSKTIHENIGMLGDAGDIALHN